MSAFELSSGASSPASGKPQAGCGFRSYSIATTANYCYAMRLGY